MTTLENRPNTALLVIDVQNGVVTGNHERDAVVANVGSLVEKARETQIPVVWVQHNDEGNLVAGNEAWKIVPELEPDDSEPVVQKRYGDSFEDTSLESVLSDLGVGRLVVAGAQTDMCIRSTLHGALDPRQGCAHDGGPDGVGGAAARSGDRAHEHVLVGSGRSGPDGRDDRDEGRGLQLR